MLQVTARDVGLESPQKVLHTKIYEECTEGGVTESEGRDVLECEALVGCDVGSLRIDLSIGAAIKNSPGLSSAYWAYASSACSSLTNSPFSSKNRAAPWYA